MLMGSECSFVCGQASISIFHALLLFPHTQRFIDVSLSSKSVSFNVCVRVFGCFGCQCEYVCVCEIESVYCSDLIQTVRETPFDVRTLVCLLADCVCTCIVFISVDIWLTVVFTIPVVKMLICLHYASPRLSPIFNICNEKIGRFYAFDCINSIISNWNSAFFACSHGNPSFAER